MSFPTEPGLCASPSTKMFWTGGRLLVDFRNGVIGADLYISGFLQRPS